MKLLIVLCLSVVAVSALKIPDEILKMFEEEIKSYKEECRMKSKVEVMHIEKVLKDVDLTFGNNKLLKCYWSCLEDKMMIKKMDGTYDVDVINKKLPFITRELAVKCAEEARHEMDRCDQAHKFAKCVIEVVAA